MNKRQALTKVIEQLLGEETQVAVAKRAGLTQTEISLYKKGKRYPMEKNRVKLAKGFRCTLKQLDALEWKFRTEGPEERVDPGIDSRRLTGVDGAKIADPHLRQLFEEVSLASYHASALTENVSSINEKLIAYLADQAAARRAKRRRKRAPPR